MLTFPLNDILGRLSSFSQATSPSAAEEIVEPALGILNLYPETSCYARVLQGSASYCDKTADYHAPVRILQEKVGRILPRIRSDFGKKSDFTLEELVEIGHPGKLSLRNPIRDVVLASGHPSLYAESLPLLLGGLFTFSEGGWAEIRWDERSLLESYRPLPTGGLAVAEGIDHEDAPIMATTWNQAERIERMVFKNTPSIGTRQKGHYRWRNGSVTSSVTFDGKLRRFTQTRHEIEPDRETAVRITYDYPRHSQRLVENSGIGAAVDHELAFSLDSLDVSSQPRDSQLSYSVPQFFYLPGAVLESSVLHPREVEHIEWQDLLTLLPEARHLRDQGAAPDDDFYTFETVSGPEGPVYSFRPKDPRLPATRIQFDARNEEGLPLEWRLDMDLKNMKGRIDALRVTEETVDAVEKYVRGKFERGLEKVE
jgi:hypothetical protein